MQHQGLFRTRKGGQILIHSSEKRLLVVLGYNALFIVAVTVFSSLAGSNVSQRFTQALTEHFTCEALGHTPGRCDRAVSDQYNTAWVFTVILVLLSLIPAVSLVHIWNTRRLKQLRCCSRNHTWSYHSSINMCICNTRLPVSILNNWFLLFDFHCI